MSANVIEMILSDHREFERLLREVRRTDVDRRAVLSDLAALLVAHAEAEEQAVYPTLRRREVVDTEEVEHGREEHAEGHESLLALLEVEDVRSEEFGEAVEDLTRDLAHHMDEEERTVLNPAREEFGQDLLVDLGRAFASERERQLDSDCGAIDNVRRLVERAARRGLIEGD